jgi:hypothetical protein
MSGFDDYRARNRIARQKQDAAQGAVRAGGSLGGVRVDFASCDHDPRRGWRRGSRKIGITDGIAHFGWDQDVDDILPILIRTGAI